MSDQGSAHGSRALHAYVPPRLVRHGTLAELTAAQGPPPGRPPGGGGPPDGKPPPAGKNDGNNSPTL